MRVALNCYPPRTPTGLGTLCRNLQNTLPFHTGLFFQHPRHGGDADWNKFTIGFPGLEDVDCVVSLERPLPEGLFAEAKRLGKRTVLVVMHEWINSKCSWLPYIDIFIAPNQCCVDKLFRLGIHPDKVKLCMPPLDLTSLPFTERASVKQFVFSNGWGGVNGRKGWLTMQRMLPELADVQQNAIKLFSQATLDKSLCQVEEAEDTQALYAGMDAALVPSYCEGLGFSILEPMALGMPVITTNAPPMNEYLRAAYGDLSWECLVPVAEVKILPVWGCPVEYHIPSVSALTDAINRALEWSPKMVAELSRCGRQWITEACGEQSQTDFWRIVTDA